MYLCAYVLQRCTIYELYYMCKRTLFVWVHYMCMHVCIHCICLHCIYALYAEGWYHTPKFMSMHLLPLLHRTRQSAPVTSTHTINTDDLRYLYLYIRCCICCVCRVVMSIIIYLSVYHIVCMSSPRSLSGTTAVCCRWARRGPSCGATWAWAASMRVSTTWLWAAWIGRCRWRGMRRPRIYGMNECIYCVAYAFISFDTASCISQLHIFYSSDTYTPHSRPLTGTTSVMWASPWATSASPIKRSRSASHWSRHMPKRLIILGFWNWNVRRWRSSERVLVAVRRPDLICMSRGITQVLTFTIFIYICACMHINISICAALISELCVYLSVLAYAH